MRILGLETTSDVCSVGIMDSGKLAAYHMVHDKNTHSVNLMPMVDSVLKAANLSVTDIDAFAVNVGPGSFTGIRIGVCTVKGLALQAGKPCIAVNTLDSLAHNVAGYSGILCAMIDARRTESYYAVYTADKKGMTRMGDYDADKLEAFLPKLPDGNVCFVGDGALNYKDVIKKAMGERALFLHDADMLPCAKAVLKAATLQLAAGDTVSAYDIEAYYLRASQAEQMKDRK